jgi:ABC-type nitrate/sulfonate/bicarbonate transport system permease component
MGSAAAVAVDAVLVYWLWQLLTATGVLPSRYFPHASAVLGRALSLIGLPAFWSVVSDTMQSWAIGLAIAVGAGTLLGILLGSSDRAYGFCQVVIEVMRPVPPVVLIPIAVLTLGAGLKMKLVLIVQGTIWIMILQAVYGVRAGDAVLLETARSYRLSAARRFLLVRLPSALPFIVTGVRICASFALIASIVSELVGGAAGLGNEILKAESAGDQQTMYALILLTGVLGLVINAVFTSVERRVLFWHPSQRGKVR